MYIPYLHTMGCIYKKGIPRRADESQKPARPHVPSFDGSSPKLLRMQVYEHGVFFFSYQPWRKESHQSIAYPTLFCLVLPGYALASHVIIPDVSDH